jgi:hypothetical protein
LPRLSESERDRYWDELIKSKLPLEPAVQQGLIDRVTREIEGADTESKIIEIVDRYRCDPNIAEVVAAKAFRQNAGRSRAEGARAFSQYVCIVD